MRNLFFCLLLLAIGGQQSYAQIQTQVIRGNIKDLDSKMEIAGATIAVLTTDPIIGAVSDLDGEFRLENVPVGRHDIRITYLGYEPITMSSIVVTSGKELVLSINLQESTVKMEEVTISAESAQDKSKPLNDMALVRARSFSVEESQRYAAGLSDPGRMAQNFAGVSVGGGEGDLSNAIVIRGNSSRGLLWRLEGIEIPNPNHFSDVGSSGGAISMLSSSTLATSDFYTGAFPSEFGNAVSGVFDLNLRNGNNEKREFSVMIGILGLAASAEGYFSKKSKASYLVNYRYSTLAALKAIGLNPVGDVLPTYQDVSFKVNIPTQKFGTLSLWGLGGNNVANIHPAEDSATWKYNSDNWGYTAKNHMGVVGLSHRIMLNKNSYFKTVIAASSEKNSYDDYWLDVENNYTRVVDEIDLFNNATIRANLSYTNKLSAKHTIKTGLIFNHLLFNFEYKEKDSLRAADFRTYLDNDGSAQLLQGFIAWKYRPHNNWTINSGVHYTQFLLNNSISVEPRLALKWNMASKHALSLAAGIHSKPEHLAFYFVEQTHGNQSRSQPNKNIDMQKAAHFVLGYDWQISSSLRLKAEAYYQQLYDVPVENLPNSSNSIINANSIWDIVDASAASNDGTGRNYGLDLTFEKFFDKQYYFLITGSLFESKFTPKDGVEYSTRFNTNYQLNMLGGKEFKVGKNRNNVFALNGKFLLAGGNRYTPIDLAASKLAGYTIFEDGRDFEAQAAAYYRFDLSLSFKINKKRTTHTLMLDIQNVTNHENVYSMYYNPESNSIEKYLQNGIFPVLNYKFEF